MITANITAGQYSIKTAHHIKTLNNIRLIIPKDWDCDYVNVVLWENDCELKISDPEKYELTVPNCGEILLRRVIREERRHYVYLPVRYDEQEVLIVPV